MTKTRYKSENTLEFEREQRARQMALYLLSNLKLAIEYIENKCEATFESGTIAGNANRLIRIIEDGQ